MTALAALGVATTLAGCSGTQGPAAVVEDLYRAIDGGNCAGFSARFSEATRRMMGAKLDSVCQSAAQQTKEKGEAARFKALHVLQQIADGDRAVMRVQPEMRDGSRGEESQVRLVRESGEWKIEPVK